MRRLISFEIFLLDATSVMVFISCWFFFLQEFTDTTSVVELPLGEAPLVLQTPVVTFEPLPSSLVKSSLKYGNAADWFGKPLHSSIKLSLGKLRNLQ